MGSFVSVQQYDAKKTPVVTNVLQCPFFRSCNCVVQWQTKYHDEGKSAWLFCNARHHRRSHVKYNGRFLWPIQKGAVSRAVQNDPNCMGSTSWEIWLIFRTMWFILIMGWRIQLIGLWSERDAVLSRNLGGMRVGGNKHDEVHKLRHIGYFAMWDITGGRMCWNGNG